MLSSTDSMRSGGTSTFISQAAFASHSAVVSTDAAAVSFGISTCTFHKTLGSQLPSGLPWGKFVLVDEFCTSAMMKDYKQFLCCVYLRK